MKKNTQIATMMSVGIIPRSLLMKYLSMDRPVCVCQEDSRAPRLPCGGASDGRARAGRHLSSSSVKLKLASGWMKKPSRFFAAPAMFCSFTRKIHGASFQIWRWMSP